MFVLTHLFGRFRRNRMGAVTIEFAMVVLPFLALVLAIIEGALQQYFTSELDRVTQSVAMAIRNGNLQVKTLSADGLRATYYCPNLPTALDCGKVYISLQVADCASNGNCWAGMFSDYAAGRRQVPALSDGAFNVGTVGQSQYLTATYPLLIGSLLWDNSATAVVNGEKVRAVVSVATWVNDPSVQFF
jgi:Flp pilus assembly protein TadG